MKYQRIQKDPLKRITSPHNKHDGLPPIIELPEGEPLPPTPENEAYVPKLDKPTKTTDGKKWVQKLTLTQDGWEEVDKAAPSAEAILAQARAGMSALIATLPVESRAKFAESRAGVEKLLDIGDIEAAHYKVNQIETSTTAEANVKDQLLGGLAQLLPQDDE